MRKKSNGLPATRLVNSRSTVAKEDNLQGCLVGALGERRLARRFAKCAATTFLLRKTVALRRAQLVEPER